MFEYCFKANKDIIHAHSIILVLLVVVNKENTLSTHYFHQYPHDLHNKIIEYQSIEPNTDNNSTLLYRNIRGNAKTKQLSLPNLPSIEVMDNNISVSQVVPINEYETSNESIEITRTHTDTSDAITQNCTSNWQCEVGRQCIDSICILGCMNNTDCESNEVCEPNLGRCTEKPIEGLVLKNGYMYGKSALESNANDLCSQRLVQFLLIVFGKIAVSSFDYFLV